MNRLCPNYRLAAGEGSFVGSHGLQRAGDSGSGGTLSEIHANLDEAVVHLKRAIAKARQGGHG